MPQFGDEHMQAAGVEEAVVSPKVEQYILGIDHLICLLYTSEARQPKRIHAVNGGVGEREHI